MEDLDKGLEIIKQKLKFGLSNEEEAEWGAKEDQLLALRDYFERLHDEKELATTKYVTFPISMENTPSHFYIQSLRFDRLGSSPWIKYLPQDDRYGDTKLAVGSSTDVLLT